MYYIIVFSLLLLGLASAQDCSTLNVDRQESGLISGADLRVCQFNGEQCCTQEYLDRVKRDIGEALLNGIRDELDNRMDVMEEVFEELAEYFEGDFIDSYIANFPFANILGDVSTVITRLQELVSRAQFVITSETPAGNLDEIFADIMSRVEELIMQHGLLSTEQKSCVITVLRSNLNQTGMMVQERSLKNLRRSYTAISRIITFLRQFNRTLGGFELPSECLARFVDISFCSRCRMALPPLCGNTCGGIVRGCFAGFYSGLNAEFTNLWRIVAKVVDGFNRDIGYLSEAESFFEGGLSLIELASNCSLTFPPGKRQAPTFALIPSALMTRVMDLTGVFQYGRDGPEFCQVSSQEEDFCRGNRNGNSDRSCDSDEICTSMCMCWNGTVTRETNTEPFEGSSIEDQVNNPYFKDTIENYVAKATSLMTPVNAFLTSDEFTAVLPTGVEIPAASPYISPSGSVVPTVSMAVTVGAILFSVLNM